MIAESAKMGARLTFFPGKLTFVFGLGSHLLGVVANTILSNQVHVSVHCSQYKNKKRKPAIAARPEPTTLLVDCASGTAPSFKHL